MLNANANVTDPKMRPFTLSFEGVLEDEFRDYYYRTSLSHIRVALVVGFVFYCGFGVLDWLLAPYAIRELWFIRYALICPSSVVSLIASYTRPFKRYHQLFTGATVLWAGLGIIAMIVVASPAVNISYYVGLILVFIYCYAFIKLRFVWATLIAWLIVVAYEIVAVWGIDTRTVDLVANNFFFLSANAIGMFACYYIEFHTRRSFLSMHLLEAEKRKTESINQQLTQEVTQRKKAEEALERHRDKLEEAVAERTSELELSNEQLRQEILQRRMAEDAKTAVEAQLRHTQKMEAIGTLAGGIAHDFNNILSAVIGYTDFALTKLPASSPARSYLGQVLKATGRARDLVQQILTFSRQGEQERRLLEIHLIVKEALKLLRASLPTTIDIRQSVPSHCGTILADPTQIHQVIMNLCTNAYHAMRDTGGVLEVRLQAVSADHRNATPHAGFEAGDYVELVVRDSGPGMDEATLDRIFEPFYTTKAIDEGTGMGLSIVHGIVTSHGGAVTVDSKLGVGTTFHVYLPRLDTEAPPAALTSEPVPRGKERILFVDDEEALADLGKINLERFGFRVTSHTSSLNALHEFRSRPDEFDLVITDQTMPSMTGVELCREILRIRPEIPVVLTTGFSESITPETASGFGIRELVLKPLVPEELARTVRNVMDAVHA